MIIDNATLAQGLLDTPEWNEVFEHRLKPEPITLGSDGWKPIEDDVTTKPFGKKDIATVIAMHKSERTSHRRLLLLLKDGRYAFVHAHQDNDGNDVFMKTDCVVASKLSELLKHGLTPKDYKRLGLSQKNRKDRSRTRT